ncbi:hypothetical protein M5689_002826 [Euphorbia peplus]|nr:hypothetical protein M5689_002826 [Euphorbia peplus]
MEFLFKGMNEDKSDCQFDATTIQRCPFLRNINKTTSFSFSTVTCPSPVRGGGGGAKGPIFEDGSSFDSAFKLFHGKDGVVPLSSSGCSFQNSVSESDSTPMFNPLAAKAATISLSAFGPGGPFGFGFFNDKLKNQRKKSEPNNKNEKSSQEGNTTSKHEALGNEWLETGNCPIAKSYRAVSNVLPLVASTLQIQPGVKFRCPPAVVAARAALARTALVKNLRPQPLPAKMLAIALLGMAVNVPLGVWKEHTKKFSLSWFAAIHAAVPFIAMLRKSVLMPKSAMALTIGASILGQVIGSRAERHRLKTVVEKEPVATQTAINATAGGFSLGQVGGITGRNYHNNGKAWDPLGVKVVGSTSSPNDVCC